MIGSDLSQSLIDAAARCASGDNSSDGVKRVDELEISEGFNDKNAKRIEDAAFKGLDALNNYYVNQGQGGVAADVIVRAINRLPKDTVKWIKKKL